MSNHWMSDAACTPDPRWTSDKPPTATDFAEMRAICLSCPVQIQCLEHAITTHASAGFYGGIYLPPPERKNHTRPTPAPKQPPKHTIQREETES